MRDPETFLVELYVLADAYCKAEPATGEVTGGRPASLAPSEVVTLALFGQWGRFQSERDFYQFADRHLRPYFPTLPSRSQLNRLVRHQQDRITRFTLWLATQLGAETAAYEILDGTAVPTRNAKRRGRGWLAGLADVGRCLRRGWIHGLRLLVCTTPEGTVTGWGVGPASTNDRLLAETFFAARATPGALPSAGTARAAVYVADRGFSGRGAEARWVTAYQAQLVAPPHPRAAAAWPAADRRWLAGHRQVVETVIARLQQAFRLDRERPHSLDGFLARLAAKLGLHNFCLWLNRRHGQSALALADVLGW